MARRTRGSTSLGPGPRRTRLGGLSSSTGPGGMAHLNTDKSWEMRHKRVKRTNPARMRQRSAPAARGAPRYSVAALEIVLQNNLTPVVAETTHSSYKTKNLFCRNNLGPCSRSGLRPSAWGVRATETLVGPVEWGRAMMWLRVAIAMGRR